MSYDIMIIDSAICIKDQGKTKVKVWINGETQLLDAVPEPCFYIPADYQIPQSAMIAGKVEQTTFKTIDTDQLVKKCVFGTYDQRQVFADTLKQRKENPVALYESDKNYIESWMLVNGHTCSDYPNQAAWDIEVDDSHGQVDVKNPDKEITALSVFYKANVIHG